MGGPSRLAWARRHAPSEGARSTSWPRGASPARDPRRSPPGPISTTRQLTPPSPVPSPTPPPQRADAHARPTPHPPSDQAGENPRRARAEPQAPRASRRLRRRRRHARVVGHGDGILRKLRRALPDRPARRSRKPPSTNAPPQPATPAGSVSGREGVTARGDPRWRDPRTPRRPSPTRIAPTPSPKPNPNPKPEAALRGERSVGADPGRPARALAAERLRGVVAASRGRQLSERNGSSNGSDDDGDDDESVQRGAPRTTPPSRGFDSFDAR